MKLRHSAEEISHFVINGPWYSGDNKAVVLDWFMRRQLITTKKIGLNGKKMKHLILFRF